VSNTMMHLGARLHGRYKEKTLDLERKKTE
jgi:hypothetical protein